MIVLAVGFERPARFNLEAYWRKSTAELSQNMRRYQAVLSLTPDAASRLQAWCPTTPVASADSGESAGEDRVTLQADFDGEVQARFFILGLGAGARVLRPEALQRWVRHEVKLMAAQTRRGNHGDALP